jgi:hypothetical protein
MAAKAEQMKAKFNRLDKDQSGTLDFSELKALLLKGNPGFKDAEVRTLYDACDKNGDGVIQMEEFIDYVYGKESDRVAGGAADVAEKDWAACKSVFDAFAGKDATLENKEWAKFCKEAKLIGHGMAKTDVDLIWTKVCPKGTRKIDFNTFKDMLKLVAAKRGQQTAMLQEMVEKSGGPHLTGVTATEYSRFHDDKSTYTGAHTGK